MLQLLLFVVLAMTTLAGEYLPGVANYDPPKFFFPARSFGLEGEKLSPSREPWVELLAHDNGYHHFRQLNITVRSFGPPLREWNGKVIKHMSFEDMKGWMAKTVIAKHATNAPKVEEVEFAGRKALRVKQVTPMPQMAPGASLIFDYIWVPLEFSRVLELKQVATNEELLKTIGDSLDTFKILAK
jgi:hypothetical protein